MASATISTMTKEAVRDLIALLTRHPDLRREVKEARSRGESRGKSLVKRIKPFGLGSKGAPKSKNGAWSGGRAAFRGRFLF